MTALLTVAMVLAGCDNTPADLHGLPKDAAERATLCGRAAVAFAAAGSGKGAAEEKRRQDLLQTVVDKTGFFGATGLDDEKGKALLGDIEGTLKGGNWLGTLNQCKAAYALGDPEALPELPGDPKEKPAACAAVAVASAFRDGSGDLAALQKNVLMNPQSSYFLIAAAAQDGGIAAAQNAMVGKVEWAISSGAVGPLTEACVKEYPKAAATTAVTLPADDGQAVAACGFNVGLMGALEGEEGAMAKAVEAKLRGGTALPDMSLASNPKKLIEQALDLGPLGQCAEGLRRAVQIAAGQAAPRPLGAGAGRGRPAPTGRPRRISAYRQPVAGPS
ncbi:hypothetical protein [Sphingopyxis sp. PET50]|uniref:hypothetical protein n=1 Tax=Sphingopyxis sp. PET50 TaxID=2976533 RepID=UPI0021AEA513|nr:hypothetical protein [Sphingopyxis sp. PET50]